MSGSRMVYSLIVAAGAIAFASTAFAQNWVPDRPVTLVVPYAPGGGTDVSARYIAKELQRVWKQSVVVQNLPGADGLIGSRKVIDSPPDGYTLLVQLPSLTMSARNPGFSGVDPVTQLTPISPYVVMSGVIVTHTSLPGNTMKEVISYCKTANPACTFATTENVAKVVGKMIATEVPSLAIVNYKGGGQAIGDLLGNNVNMGFLGATAVLPHVKAGRVKVVMSMGSNRSPVLPDIPTASESGYPDMTSDTWYGLFAPKGTPTAIVDSISAAVREAVKSDAYVKEVGTLGGRPLTGTPAEFSALVNQTGELWRDRFRRFPID